MQHFNRTGEPHLTQAMSYKRERWGWWEVEGRGVEVSEELNWLNSFNAPAMLPHLLPVKPREGREGEGGREGENKGETQRRRQR